MSKIQPPKVGDHLILSFPSQHVLQLTLNRPKQLNAMTDALESDLSRVLDWFETEASLWVVIVTGRGRGFCAGQDLKEWLEKKKQGGEGAVFEIDASTHLPIQSQSEIRNVIQRVESGGFGSISTRKSSKPFIAAIDGVCMGGGMEIMLNCDLVVASSRSTFALPEVARGVVAAQGGIPRLSQICGHQKASELVLTGRPIQASEASEKFNLINLLVPISDSVSVDEGQRLIELKALELAQSLTLNSPDALMVTKEALVLCKGELDQVTKKSYSSQRSRHLYLGSNVQEGLLAFKEKRKPKWSDPITLKSKL
ncbi:ClpP/crotonase [Violaceomyces palustris]|uniref:ClpP/crotonase n=1 Tax=Violaceomyces palustris TaxID=1673888 RepID=A0ACD0NQY5_9BASI|nr:ClpP/crotonase [Violaceomyces palustris]